MLKTLARNGVNTGEDGKGRATWLAYGYVIAAGKADVIALHGCGILTYNRELLARLCYSVVILGLDHILMVMQKDVTPAKAGVQGNCNCLNFLDSVVHRNDENMHIRTFCMIVTSCARLL